MKKKERHSVVTPFGTNINHSDTPQTGENTQPYNVTNAGTVHNLQGKLVENLIISTWLSTPAPLIGCAVR